MSWRACRSSAHIALDTPYGAPSRAVQEGSLGGSQVFFLQRHGSPNAIPPHRINYRANLWALRSLGATDIVAINAVGGIAPHMPSGVSGDTGSGDRLYLGARAQR